MGLKQAMKDAFLWLGKKATKSTGKIKNFSGKAIADKILLCTMPQGMVHHTDIIAKTGGIRKVFGLFLF